MPHETIEECVDEVWGGVAQHTYKVGVCAEELPPPVVVAIPIRPNRKHVLQHESRNRKLSIPKCPIEGRYGSPIHFHVRQPRHPIRPRRAHQGLLQPRQVAIHQSDRERRCPGLKAHRKAACSLDPQAVPSLPYLVVPHPTPLQTLLYPVQDGLPEWIHVPGLHPILDVPNDEGLELLKEVLGILSETNHHLYRLHEHVGLHLAGPLEQVYQLWAVLSQIVVEKVTKLQARSRHLNTLPRVPNERDLFELKRGHDGLQGGLDLGPKPPPRSSILLWPTVAPTLRARWAQMPHHSLLHRCPNLLQVHPPHAQTMKSRSSGDHVLVLAVRIPHQVTAP
mmetsp:Transcript_12892/g.31634  ORF Transcript_12892/g.31634 Transcript_12892/m.31634 type:complete len:336 (-) Transcript_12892:366-1373(-)